MVTTSVWPCRQSLAFVCWYSSKLHVNPNQIRMCPPCWMFRPCPADAGWIRATGIFPAFQSLMSVLLLIFIRLFMRLRPYGKGTVLIVLSAYSSRLIICWMIRTAPCIRRRFSRVSCRSVSRASTSSRMLQRTDR